MSIPKKVVLAVFERDSYECQYNVSDQCVGTQPEQGHCLHAHHVIHKSQGGPDTIENLKTCCAFCHHEHGAVSKKDKAVDVILCSFSDYVNYICFEHTTYIFEFSPRFGPTWLRLEGNKEIEVEFEFNDDNEVTSNKFLWDIFENMRMPGEKDRS